MKLPQVRSVARSVASAVSWRNSSTRVRRISILAVLVVIASGSLAGLVITRGAHAANTSSADPFTWGSNNQGYLGINDSTTPSGSTPNDVTGIGITVNSVVSGSSALHALAVASDGSLWGWGDNTSNAITATAGNMSYPAPVQVAGISGVKAAAAGASFTLALTSNGVYAWGANTFGQLGIGTTTSPAGPTLITFPPNTPAITAISAGNRHSLALDASGNVWAWGYGGLGALGTGTLNSSSSPVLVSAPAGVTFTAVAAGQFFSLALSSTGTVYAWGSNSAGQQGNGTSGTNVLSPTAIAGLSGVTSIGAGQTFAVAAGSSGVYAWGDNTYGEIGNGSAAGGTVLTPSLVGGLSGLTVTAVAAGDSHALALTSSGSVYAWGNDADGQDGANGAITTCNNSVSNPCAPSAVQVTSLPTPSSISAGTQFSVALVPTAPIATLSASTFNFGNQVQGTTSAAQTITVKNTGSGSLSFGTGAVTLTGPNAADYTLTDGCSGQAVAPGGSCTLSVTFTPAALGGSTATLTINDNAAGSPQSVALSGNGTYSWSGVQSPNGTTFRAGSKVNLQFSLTGASASITTATAQAFEALVTNGTPGTYTATTGSPPNTGNNFSYSSHSSNYTYTWSTKGLSAGTYSVQVTLNDGTTGTITIILQ